jgi:hypothetical protein
MHVLILGRLQISWQNDESNLNYPNGITCLMTNGRLPFSTLQVNSMPVTRLEAPISQRLSTPLLTCKEVRDAAISFYDCLLDGVRQTNELSTIIQHAPVQYYRQNHCEPAAHFTRMPINTTDVSYFSPTSVSSLISATLSAYALFQSARLQCGQFNAKNLKFELRRLFDQLCHHFLWALVL